MLIHEIHVFEVQMETIFLRFARNFQRYLINSNKKGLNFSGLSLQACLFFSTA